MKTIYQVLHNDTQNTEDSFLYLDLDEVREEFQDKSDSSELGLEVQTTETESLQESEYNTEIEVEQEARKKKPSPSLIAKSKLMYSLIQKSVKKIKRKPSKIPVPVKNSQHKK